MTKELKSRELIQLNFKAHEEDKLWCSVDICSEVLFPFFSVIKNGTGELTQVHWLFWYKLNTLKQIQHAEKWRLDNKGYCVYERYARFFKLIVAQI